MISANLSSLTSIVHQLTFWEMLGEKRDDAIAEDIRDHAVGWLSVIEPVANEFEMEAAQHRIGVFRGALKKYMSWKTLGLECRVLREAIEHGLKMQLIYRYYDEQAAVLMRWKADWKAVIDSFPSAVSDVFAAVDCWALGHGTAAVFHSMRVLECGVHALAREVDVDTGTDTWQQIINNIEAKIRDLGKTLPRGEAKNERLQFLSEAAKEIVYFKDAWRNYVSHNRATYDTHQARSVMEHSRSFMSVLSRRLSEASYSGGQPS